MAAKTFLVILKIFSLLAAPLASTELHRGFRGVLTRTDQHINFTRAAHTSQQRLSMLAARLDASSSSGRVSAQSPLQLDSDTYGYDMILSIGTPPQKLSAPADTGSDLIWVKCGACKDCVPQGSPSYYPNKSSSFSILPCFSGLCRTLQSQSLATCGGVAGRDDSGMVCDYKYSYGIAKDSHHYTQGHMGRETFTLGSDAVRGVGFGCTTMSEGYYGMSSSGLVSHLRAGAFSYCLHGDTTNQSPLLFGVTAAMSGPGIQATPLLPNGGTFYTVDLQRISIGNVQTRGPGTKLYGTLFDSDTTLTFLSEPAYSRARKAMLSQTRLPRAADRDGYDMCFHTTTAGGGTGLGVVPKMILHFDGADMGLPLENYIAKEDQDVVCWIVQMSPSFSVIGTMMQANYHIKYDVDKALRHFQPANCDSV